MASTSGRLLDWQFQCSVCLEVFTDPVSTPCGHSFCRACLSSYWDGKDERQCPMCLKTFRDPLDLSVNVILAQITQDYMKSLKLPQPCSEPTKEPSCDICKEGSKKRAAKMCLPCYTSFCDDHVRSHPADHKLLDTHFEDKRVCEKHNQPLELFCSTDQTCICTLCAEAHHERHSTVPIEREWTLRCTELRKAVLEEKQLILGRQKKVQDIKQRVELSRRDSEKKQEEGLQVLAILLSYIEKCRAEFVEVIKERQRAAESRAESLVEELEQEIVELKKRNTTLKQLLSLEDHAHVLQSFPSQHTPFISKDWDAIIVNTDPCLGTVGSVFCPLEETIRKTVSKLMDAEFNKIKQHKIDVTMDPDTAHKYLSVTNSGKRVSLNPYSRRFAHDYFVQGEQLFSSGRHYWEVEVGEKTSWQLGVALESIDCREKLALSPQKDVWLLQLSSGKNLKGLTNPAVQLSPISLPRTVGVYVDYEEGQVSFYDVEAKSHLFSFTGITFTKGLCPIFSPGHIDKTPLIISSVAKPNKVWRFDLDD